MKASRLASLLPALLATLAVVLVLFWLRTGPTDGLDLRVPGLDGREEVVPGDRLAPPEAGEPITSDGKPSDLPGAWPWFRGPNRDGICHDSVPLARQWPDSGPEVLWTVELGPGHAGPAVWGGCVYVLDYDLEAMADTMRCLSLDDGREIWRNSYPVEVAESHGRSRTVPAVVDGCVVSLGPRCHAACWDAETGECRWLLDLVAEYQVKLPLAVIEWHNGQCPLVDDGRVILAPAGEAFMVALDCRSGEVIWKSPELPGWQMTHSSIAPMDFAGRRMYVYCGSRGVAGISAEDGSVLWKTTDWVGRMATSPTPVPVGDGRIFLCAGYNAGSLMLKLEEDNGQLSASTLFRLRPKQFESEQHTPILYEGHLYGLRTKPGGKQFACLDPDGNELWNSGTDKFWRGPYLIADGLIFVLDEEGLLTFAEAAPDAYKPLGSFQVFADGHEAWGPMALVGGRLILRDLTRMSCLDVSEK